MGCAALLSAWMKALKPHHQQGLDLRPALVYTLRLGLENLWAWNESDVDNFSAEADQRSGALGLMFINNEC